MRLRLKIGTMSACYRDVRGDSHVRPGIPPELLEAPRVGTRISWQELENGPWNGGVVDLIDTELSLFFVERF